jgi:hypothetical protein
MHPLFDDYKTIRRRIERKLSRPGFVLLHVGFFFFATLLLMASAPNSVPIERPFMLLVWSIVLLAHSLAMMRLSGVPDKRRETLIQQELEQRLEKDDTELVSDHRQAFRVQALLDEDIRHRAGFFVSLSALLGLNVVMWLASFGQTLEALDNFSGYWHEVARMVLAGIVPALAINRWRRTRRDQEISARLSDSALDLSEKRKRLSDEVYAFEEDGELVDEVADRLVLEDEEKTKLKT